MSERLAAAAAALGLPESLVERSAAARAAELGATTEDVINEWAGGEAAPVTEAPATQAPSPDPAPETAPAPAAAAVEPVILEAASPEPVVVAQGPYEPPVLVDSKDSPTMLLAGILGVFLIVVLVGLVGPSLAEDSPGARTSEVAFTQSALDGLDHYLSLGCASCHTQMVRPVVADIGLGPVTLNDTNQVLGTRRFGPDLSAVGSRMTSAQIEATIDGLGDHPSHNLSDEDMGALVAYLSESTGGES